MSLPASRRLRRVAGAIGRRATGPLRNAPPVVSLTFDDGSASQRITAELLAAHGLTATFYVCSGFVGGPGNLDWDDLRDLAAAGHEIGGHTARHPDLTELDAASARREIEADRSALLEHGLDPVTFAYPFGVANPAVAALVREAGYLAARRIGGFAETLPPRDPFALRTPGAVQSEMTVRGLRDLARAANRRGNWLILSFHDLGDPAETGSEWTVQPDVLAGFLGWLARGSSRVARVRDVVAGSVRHEV